MITLFAPLPAYTIRGVECGGGFTGKATEERRDLVSVHFVFFLRPSANTELKTFYCSDDDDAELIKTSPSSSTAIAITRNTTLSLPLLFYNGIHDGPKQVNCITMYNMTHSISLRYCKTITKMDLIALGKSELFRAEKNVAHPPLP